MSGQFVGSLHRGTYIQLQLSICLHVCVCASKALLPQVRSARAALLAWVTGATIIIASSLLLFGLSARQTGLIIRTYYWLWAWISCCSFSLSAGASGHGRKRNELLVLVFIFVFEPARILLCLWLDYNGVLRNSQMWIDAEDKQMRKKLVLLIYVCSLKSSYNIQSIFESGREVPLLPRYPSALLIRSSSARIWTPRFFNYTSPFNNSVSTAFCEERQLLEWLGWSDLFWYHLPESQDLRLRIFSL